MMIDKFTGPRFDRAEHDARKAARELVKKNPGNGNSFKAINDRVATLEQALGLRNANTER